MKVVAFVIPISRDLVQSPRRRHETYFQGTYMRRAALLARTFRQSSGLGGKVREPCGTRETGISQTSTTATPIRDVVMYGPLFPPLSSHVSPFRPFLPGPLPPLTVLLSISPSVPFSLSHSLPLTRSLSLMNSIAINSIKTSVVLGGFHPTPTRRMREGGEKDRGHKKSRKIQ